ncbi:hypothetical protein GIB67_018568 [Kingdonia uniflora]|uniref:Fatty acyl-CoA reductase n=1 Tax=Kingdonia uniflora TaxID=39325 RepID=A0A7J7L870_9MAGN|nr:hypothetical protein GIB67_018568 [Kingdonia uniflora]
MGMLIGIPTAPVAAWKRKLPPTLSSSAPRSAISGFGQSRSADAEEAEALAALRGLEAARHLGLQRILLLSDCQKIVSAFRERPEDLSWGALTLAPDMRVVTECFLDFRFEHERTLMDFTSIGPPIFGQYHDVAAALMVKRSNFAASLSELVSTGSGDAYAECHPDTSVALMLESELDDSTRLKGWIEMQNSTPRWDSIENCWKFREEDLGRKWLLVQNCQRMLTRCGEIRRLSSIQLPLSNLMRGTILSTNTLGDKNVLEFAKKCVKLHNLVHVSTAYVCGEKMGLVLEKAFEMGETLNGTLDLDIEYEHKVVRDTLDGLRAQGVTKELERAAMKELGIKKARQYAWLNTYVFTKAMGEMLNGQLRGDLPVSIICPSIITSTIREPFPGWIKGISRIDRLAIGYGKGKISCFVGDPELVIDLFDMVANTIVVAAIFNANQPSQYICHAEETRAQMNRWAEKDTHGLIKVVAITEGSLDSCSLIVLANALYFKGMWKRPFDKSRTKGSNFYLIDESMVNAVVKFFGSFMLKGSMVKILGSQCAYFFPMKEIGFDVDQLEPATYLLL